MLTTEEIVVVFVTLGLVALCVVIHYEGLRLFSRLFTGRALHERVRIAGMILALIALHVVEIAAFAIGYLALTGIADYGSLAYGAGGVLDGGQLSMFDYMYYSATVYSTLGFGDIVPTGPIRAMTGTEALVGLVLITWSASFTFLEMQRHWGRG